MRVEELIGLWQEGQRRLAEADPVDRPAMDRVIDELVLELQRKLGGPFTVGELARLYLDEGTDWAFQIATNAAPRNPAAWDMTTVAGTAFARYVRGAIDYRDSDRGN